MSNAASTCPFCDYTGPSDVLHHGKVVTRFDEIDFFVIEPLNPVTPGHRLVVPVEHVADFREYPEMRQCVTRQTHAGLDSPSIWQGRGPSITPFGCGSEPRPWR